MKYSFTISAIITITLLTTLGACQYRPFLKYFYQKKDTKLPYFNDKAYLTGSQNELRTAYDITLYDWFVKPNSKKRSIEGTMKIGFQAKLNRDVILLDLHRSLEIDEIKSAWPIEKFEHKKDLLYIHFRTALKANKDFLIEIKYHGKIVNVAKEGPIQWKKDKGGKDWISTQTEGIGAHYMMPCKLLLYDEPELCIIRVEVDKDLMVVANGKLDSITEKSSSKVYHHSVHNPINIYNISFNIGDFAQLEKTYLDIRNKERTIEIFPLIQNRDTADVFYDDVPIYLSHLESLYGPFPWWNDGCKFVQSTLGTSAMEHQSAISMGSIFYYDYKPPGKTPINTTVIHELSHEWWGNMISANDYCDIWIHEGMATFSELLVIEKIYGRLYYDWTVDLYSKFISNKRPVIKTCDVLYNSWVSDKDQNIYNKGAMTMHTLRVQLQNDSLFFETLKNASIHFAKKNINTDQLENYFNEHLGTDYTWLFDIYLRNTEVPTLSYTYDSVSAKLSYKWASHLPYQENLKVYALNQKEELIPLTPSDKLLNINILKGDKNLFSVANSGYVLFENLKKYRD